MFSGLPGTKIVFWDMRDSFISQLYFGGVEGNRLDAVLPLFDRVRFLYIFLDTSIAPTLLSFIPSFLFLNLILPFQIFP